MKTGKGWITLDIDGTITLDKYSVPQEVVSYLQGLSEAGWQIALATGRAYPFASAAVKQFTFPYFLIVQNGAAAFSMPQEKFLFKHYLNEGALLLLEKAFEGTNTDFLLYVGYEKGDFCYYRPNRFSGDSLSYLEELKSRQKENWRERATFDPKEIGSIPLIKAFGSPDQMTQIADRLRSSSTFQVTQLRDHHSPGYDILLITDAHATKGLAVAELLSQYGRGPLVIAAGDDQNDLSLFAQADIAIAMPHAPQNVRNAADLIAPPVKECGIIKALEIAVRHVS